MIFFPVYLVAKDKFYLFRICVPICLCVSNMCLKTFHNNKTRTCPLNILTFGFLFSEGSLGRNGLKKQPTRAARKKILSKFMNIFKKICTWIHSSKPATHLNQRSFSRILHTRRQYVLRIFNNFRQTDYKIRYLTVLSIA